MGGATLEVYGEDPAVVAQREQDIRALETLKRGGGAGIYYRFASERNFLIGYLETRIAGGDLAEYIKTHGTSTKSRAELRGGAGTAGRATSTITYETPVGEFEVGEETIFTPKQVATPEREVSGILGEKVSGKGPEYIYTQREDFLFPTQDPFQPEIREFPFERTYAPAHLETRQTLIESVGLKETGTRAATMAEVPTATEFIYEIVSGKKAEWVYTNTPRERLGSVAGAIVKPIDVVAWTRPSATFESSIEFKLTTAAEAIGIPLFKKQWASFTVAEIYDPLILTKAAPFGEDKYSLKAISDVHSWISTEDILGRVSLKHITTAKDIAKITKIYDIDFGKRYYEISPKISVSKYGSIGANLLDDSIYSTGGIIKSTKFYGGTSFNIKGAVFRPASTSEIVGAGISTSFFETSKYNIGGIKAFIGIDSKVSEVTGIGAIAKDILSKETLTIFKGTGTKTALSKHFPSISAAAVAKSLPKHTDLITSTVKSLKSVSFRPYGVASITSSAIFKPSKVDYDISFVPTKYPPSAKKGAGIGIEMPSMKFLPDIISFSPTSFKPTSQKINSKSLTKSLLKTTDKTKSRSKTGTTSDIISIQKSSFMQNIGNIITPKSITKSMSSLMSISQFQPYIPKDIVPTPFIPRPLPTTTLIPPKYRKKKPRKKGKRRPQKQKKIKYSYSPDITSAVLNIRGSISKKMKFTGFELRPLIKKKSKKKKSKAKKGRKRKRR